MTSPRRTQQERSSTTRARILEAAYASLLDGGYGATTVGAVQARAGVARGTLLHHFPTRSALMAGVVEDVVERRLVSLTDPAAAPVSPSDAPAGVSWEAVVDLVWDELRSPAFSAALELWVAARTDPDLRAALAPLQERIYARVHADVTRVVGEGHPRSGMLVQFTIDLLTGARLGGILQPRPGTDDVVQAWKATVRHLAKSD